MSRPSSNVPRRAALGLRAVVLAAGFSLVVGVPACKSQAPGAAELQQAWELVRTKPEEARAHYERAQAAGADPDEVRRGLAAVHESLQEYEQAEALVSQILETKPDDLDARLSLARLKIRRGLAREGRKELQKSLSHRPPHVPSVLVFVAMAREPDEIAAGNETLDQFNQPHFAPLRDSAEYAAARAALLDAAGDRPAAAEALAKAHETEVFNPILAMAIANTYASLGRVELAEWLLVRASQAPNATDAVHRRLAQVALAERHLTLAETAISRLRTEFKPTADALLLLATLLELRGNPEESVEVLSRALKAEGSEDSVKAREIEMRLIAALQRANQHPKAERRLRELLEKHPGYPPAVLSLAQLLVGGGKRDEALRLIAPLLNKADTRADAHQIAIAAHEANGDHEAAEKVARAFVTASGRSARAVALLVRVLVDSKRPAEALEEVRAAQREHATDATLASLDVSLTEELHGVEKAEARAREVATPGVPRLRRVLAKFYVRHDRHDDAIAVFRDIANQEPLAWEDLAVVQDRVGRLNDAIESMQRRVASSPRDTGALLKLAMMLGRANRVEEARDAYERVLLHDSQSLFALNNLAVLYAGPLAKPGEAVELARRAAAIAPRDPNVMDTLGWALVVAREPKTTREALSLLDRSSAALGSVESRYHFAVALHRAGEDVRAVKLLRAVVAAKDPFSGRESAQALLVSLENTPKPPVP